MPVSLCVKTTVGDMMKTTSMVDVPHTNYIDVTFDDIKYFSVTVRERAREEEQQDGWMKDGVRDMEDKERDRKSVV